MLKLPHCLSGPLLDSLQHVYVLLVLGSPEVGRVLPMWPHQCWKDGKDHFCWPDSILPNAAQNILATFAAKSKLLTFVQLGGHWASEKLFSRKSASNVLWYKGLHFLKGQTLEFHLLNYMRLLLALSCHLLNDSKTRWFMSHSSQFCTTRKLAEGTVTKHPIYYWRW